MFDLSEQNVRAPAVPTTKYYEILANQIKVAISPRAVEGCVLISPLIAITIYLTYGLKM